MKKKFLKEGINFKCQGSSNCCVSRGSHGYVYLSKIDLKRISKFFKIDKNTFIDKYCDTTDGFLHIKEINKNGDCQFLKNKKCTVYKARPIQCRTWPFWKENMEPKSWNTNIVTFCPGIGKGTKINYDKISDIIKKDEINSKKIIKL